jgi:RNA polymerase sigma-70 factor, ECF subfamily
MEVALDPSSLTLAGRVAAARRGDRDAFRDLVEPDLAAALGTARIVTGSDADASDAVQEALLSAWRGLDGLRDPAAFRAWFRRHVVRAALRAASRRGLVIELDLTAAAPDGDLDRAFERRMLGRAFERLEPSDRLLLTLHTSARTVAVSACRTSSAIRSCGSTATRSRRGAREAGPCRMAPLGALAFGRAAPGRGRRRTAA